MSFSDVQLRRVAMPLGTPTLQLARGVLELPHAGARTPDQDELFIQAVREDFPHVASRQLLPVGIPLNIPYLALQSTASRLAVSGVGSELETRFYGEFAADAERSIEYVTNKLLAVLRGWAAVDAHPSFIGVVFTLNFPLDDEDETPAAFLAQHHFSGDIPADQLQDALARVAVRVADTYFMTLAAANFESRSYERPVFPGQQLLQVRPWEGTVDASGVELTIDINNKLALINRAGDFAVDEDAVVTIMDLMRRAIASAPTTFVETGSVDMDALAPREA
jgi:hypothetical protein